MQLSFQVCANVCFPILKWRYRDSTSSVATKVALKYRCMSEYVRDEHFTCFYFCESVSLQIQHRQVELDLLHFINQNQNVFTKICSIIHWLNQLWERKIFVLWMKNKKDRTALVSCISYCICTQMHLWFHTAPKKHTGYVQIDSNNLILK